VVEDDVYAPSRAANTNAKRWRLFLSARSIASLSKMVAPGLRFQVSRGADDDAFERAVRVVRAFSTHRQASAPSEPNGSKTAPPKQSRRA
jgi:hypothetical protein